MRMVAVDGAGLDLGSAGSLEVKFHPMTAEAFDAAVGSLRSWLGALGIPDKLKVVGSGSTVWLSQSLVSQEGGRMTVTVFAPNEITRSAPDDGPTDRVRAHLAALTEEAGDVAAEG
jgi:hypothetical protein